MRTTTVTLGLPMPVRLIPGLSTTPSRSSAVRWSIALPIDARVEEGQGQSHSSPTGRSYPKSPWNYALQIDRDHPERSVTFEDHVVGPTPFSPERRIR